MKNLFLIGSLFFISTAILNGQQMFDKFIGSDIGNPKLKGNVVFDNEKQTFTLTGAGYNMWFDRDEFYFVHQKVKGDFIFSGNMKFIGERTDPHRKMGLMVRNSLDDNAIYADMAIHGDSLTSRQYRQKTGANTIESKMNCLDYYNPDFVQLERKKDTVFFRISKNGEPLKSYKYSILDFNESVYVGMFVCSHNEEVLETARFSNVRLDIPAAEGVNGYENPSPSRLEIVNIDNGIRKVIYETNHHIEAPNWSRDGKYLIYNSAGKLYKFDLKDKIPVEINTGFATSNNNDHGISFDGKTLAISHHLEEKGKRSSIIYTLPVEGGTPKRITQKGPSYWHGWSPDGKWLTYCAERNGQYDVYKIPSEGGEEIQLTNNEGLDDGPEYSPDGNYIYFNSTRSGMMQIWRMKPDGSEPEQVTNDGFQNWFAHPSPDGKWIIIISYPKEVPARSHPHNQRVMLRIMNLQNKNIKAVAFLYGGQGTINVPSWSPDAKKVAFVSYTY